MANKTDCFAYYNRLDRGGECRALRVLDCDNCSFYKTEEQVEEEREAAERRHKKVGWMKGDKE